MAEVVGAVASGISFGTLAAQITISISKIKTFWDNVKEVPEDITMLVEHIEHLGRVLAEIEEDQRRNPFTTQIIGPDSTSKCLEYCRKGFKRLEELVDDLNADIQASNGLKRKFACVKLVLKKDKIKKYKSNFEKCNDVIDTVTSELPKVGAVISSMDILKIVDTVERNIQKARGKSLH